MFSVSFLMQMYGDFRNILPVCRCITANSNKNRDLQRFATPVYG